MGIPCEDEKAEARQALRQVMVRVRATIIKFAPQQ